MRPLGFYCYENKLEKNVIAQILDFGVSGEAEWQEKKENYILLISLASRFIAELTERSGFSVVR